MPDPRSTRVALITGATGSVGRAVAATLAADGWSVGLGGTDLARLKALSDELGLGEDRWVAAVGDLARGSAARSAVGAVVARFGRIDALLHFVGGWTGETSIADLGPDVLERMLDQHVWSTFHTAHAVVPGMMERGWGRVVAITSSYTTAPTAGASAYLAAKAAEETLIRVLAREVGESGVTANVLAVRTIDTERQRETTPSAKNAAWTTPDEIAATIRYLCSDEAAAINGQRIALDGRG